MADIDTLAQAIADNAAGPAKASGDSGSVEQHSLADQIAAAKFLASRAALKSGMGIKINTVVMPGAVSGESSV